MLKKPNLASGSSGIALLKQMNHDEQQGLWNYHWERLSIWDQASELMGTKLRKNISNTVVDT